MTITPGAHVYIGRPSRRKVHWVVTSVNKSAHTATLYSGLTGRRVHGVSLDALTIHTPATREGVTNA